MWNKQNHGGQEMFLLGQRIQTAGICGKNDGIQQKCGDLMNGGTGHHCGNI